MADNFKYIAPGGCFRLALKSGLRVRIGVIENNALLRTLVAKLGDDKVTIGYEDIVVAMPAQA